MKNFALSVLFFAVTAVVVLLGGLIGGVAFITILKRIFVYGIIMGGLGFVLTFLLEKFSGESLSEPPSDINPNFNPAQGDQMQEESMEEQEDVNSSQTQDNSDYFDYTLQDDDEIEFKPLDEGVMQKDSNPVLDYHGEKIEIDPKKAAQTIRQLLKEDGGDEE